MDGEQGRDRVAAAAGSVWAAAAVASLFAGTEVDLAAALAADPLRREVLDRAGLLDGDDLAHHWAAPTRPQLARAIVSGLGQAQAAARGTVTAWADQPDEVLVAQGEASAAGGRAVVETVTRCFPDVAQTLAAGGRVLDVGTGVGAIATVFAQAFPGARVHAIDLAERPLALARARLADLPPAVRERITLEQRDVAAVTGPPYALEWLPVPFVAPPALDAALPRLVAALQPGGVLVAAAAGRAPDPLVAAATRWAATLAGGCGEGADEVAARLAAAGLVDLVTTPSFPGGPELVAGRRAAGG